MKVSAFFIGLGTGLAAGAAAVLFSAPQSGPELRSSMKSSSSEWKERMNELKEKLNGVKEAVSKVSEESKTTVTPMVEELKQSFARYQEETAPAKEHLQLELKAIQNSITAIEDALKKDKKNDKNEDNDEDKKDERKGEETPHMKSDQ